MAIFPPLTTNETAVFDVLAFGPTGDFTTAMIAEATGLDETRVERALRSLECRNPPLVVAMTLASRHWRVAGQHDDDEVRQALAEQLRRG
ncbi:MAG TPA: hypothetical protein VN672_07640 [Solirubrobacteraceae bacterium]|nr:hypothetical protein [Solirubrobacteraceae bacterium]